MKASQLLGAMAGSVLSGLVIAEAADSRVIYERPSHSKSRAAQRHRYLGMTEEQRVWNEAIDAKRKQKGQS